MFNRIHNCSNPAQGAYKRVLCVCSAGLLRSPTAAIVLAQEPFNFNTRACGTEQDHALIAIDKVLLTWADEIVCMTISQEKLLKSRLKDLGRTTKVICLEIEDSYAYRDPELINLIKDNYQLKTKVNSKKDDK